MEGMLLAGIAGLAWIASMIAWHDGGAPTAIITSRLLRGTKRRFLVVLARLGRLRLVDALLTQRAWRIAADDLSKRLASGSERLSRSDACALILVAIAFGATSAGILFGSPASALVAAVMLTALVPAYVSHEDRRRTEELTREMPSIFRTLSVAMGSGQTLAQAIDYVGSHGKGPAGEGFARASLRLRCGASADEALDALSRELDAPGVDLLATALVISHRTGSPLRGLFLRSARLVERQGEFERLLSVKTAQARLSVRIVCSLPVAMVALLSMISPDFQAGLATPAGIASLVVALTLDGIALAIVRGLLKGVL
jgi:tight adherence protein B